MPNRQDSSRPAPEMGKKGTVSTARVEQADATAAAANARVSSAEQAIEVSVADLKVFDSQIADADLKLARTDVKTPVSGTISAKNAKVGAIAAGNGDPLFTIIRNGDIELVAEVAESDIVRVMAGQKATISLSGSREKLSGSVRCLADRRSGHPPRARPYLHRRRQQGALGHVWQRRDHRARD